MTTCQRLALTRPDGTLEPGDYSVASGRVELEMLLLAEEGFTVEIEIEVSANLVVDDLRH